MNAKVNRARPLNIMVLGASGDLSVRKILPGLFALFARGFLPENVRFYGFARSALNDAGFRERIGKQLQCEEIDDHACGLARNDFLRRCFYQAGAYDQAQDYRLLWRRMAEAAGTEDADCLWYLAVPPSVFSPVIAALGAAGLVRPGEDPWSRIVIEKPFGRDRASSDALTQDLQTVFREEQTFRIDHYLGKEVIQNLMVLRFANTVFEPIWNRDYIRHVHIAWKEDLSLEGRGGYFDDYGIIRDVLQNHLTQMLALIGMECPWELGAHYVRDEKVRLLRQVPPLAIEDLALGQYQAGSLAGKSYAGYRESADVPDDSRTPTYAAAVLKVMSPRWRGVPFLISAGKGLASRHTEIRMHFKPVEHALFRLGQQSPPPNELVIRVQPDEDIHFRIVSKAPGIGMTFDTPKLDLSYRSTYAEKRIADAYENLLLDVIQGERSLFIRSDELEAAWDIFTPVLQRLEDSRHEPQAYAFGSRGPAGVEQLARRYGIEDPYS